MQACPPEEESAGQRYFMLVRQIKRSTGIIIPVLSLMVELRGIEPLSENNLTGLSSGAVCYFRSLAEAGTNTLIGLVESSCMGESTLSRRTVTTQITP